MMISYLIKVTLVWSILLLLYELVFKKSHHFSLNRMYLILALLAGIVLPVVPLHFSWIAEGTKTLNDFSPKIISADDPVPVQNVAGHILNVFQWWQVIFGLYTSGSILFLAVGITDMVHIYTRRKYSNAETMQGYHFYKTGKTHAPFSFMGRIFISRPEQYAPQELIYILKHEAAHNKQKHWVDNIFVQFVLVIFWFHPLVWRYRYLIKLAHEYEADKIAATDHVYEYGHFLLQQVLLKGTPGIAHSFHYSPIKNRISMLTNNKKTSSWKYLLLVPALMGCAVLLAQSSTYAQRIKEGNVTTFKGNKFYWKEEQADANVEYPALENKAIVKVNNEEVFLQDATAAMEKKNMDRLWKAGDYLKEQLVNKVGKVSDSLMSIGIENIVTDKEGKVIYYDVRFMSADKNGVFINEPFGQEKEYSKIVDEIIAASPQWVFAIEGTGNYKFAYLGVSIQMKPFKAMVKRRIR